MATPNVKPTRQQDACIKVAGEPRSSSTPVHFSGKPPISISGKKGFPSVPKAASKAAWKDYEKAKRCKTLGDVLFGGASPRRVHMWLRFGVMTLGIGGQDNSAQPAGKQRRSASQDIPVRTAGKQKRPAAQDIPAQPAGKQRRPAAQQPTADEVEDDEVDLQDVVQLRKALYKASRRAIVAQTENTAAEAARAAEASRADAACLEARDLREKLIVATCNNCDRAQLLVAHDEVSKSRIHMSSLEKSLKQKDALLEARDADLRAKDADLRAKDVDLRAKDVDLRAKDEQLMIKDQDLKALNEVHRQVLDERTKAVTILKMLQREGNVGIVMAPLSPLLGPAPQSPALELPQASI